jgi:hypothetical protein
VSNEIKNMIDCIACNRKKEEATGGNRTNVAAWKRRQFFISLIEESEENRNRTEQEMEKDSVSKPMVMARCFHAWQSPPTRVVITLPSFLSFVLPSSLSFVHSFIYLFYSYRCLSLFTDDLYSTTL